MVEHLEPDEATREEMVRARLRDPEVQQRIAEAKARIARGEYGTPLRGEELREFLDEQLQRYLGDR